MAPAAKPPYPIAVPTALETRCMMLVVLLPKAVIEVTMTTNTRTAIMAYSIAVAPSSSAR
jgi:hypothetical protein